MDVAALLQHRLAESWLVGVDAARVRHLTQQRLAELADAPPTACILLADSDPAALLAGLFAATLARCSLALGNPQWTATDWHRAIALLHPTHDWRSPELSSVSLPPAQPPHPPSRLPLQPHLLIPTGGTSGQLRFVIHTWETLSASAYGFRQFLQRELVNSCCVLPLHHVSGLMQLVRSLLSGGTLTVHDYKALLQGNLPPIQPADYVISLVPTQLQRLLDQPHTLDWLRQFHTVLLGGAPAWQALLDAAQQQRLPIALTYGMTETASQVATQSPEHFLQGQRSCGLALSHARIQIWDAHGQLLPPLQVGEVRVEAASLGLGYLPLTALPSPFPTDDMGYVDEAGRLWIVGRSSDKIITGGENVFASEVEAAIRATGLVQDVAVLGVSDRHWGEVVTAVYVAQSSNNSQPGGSQPDGSQSGDRAELETAIAQHLCTTLAPAKRPKRWVALDQLPRNQQGKLNRAALKALLE
ncbi:MAG: AMP-binding protein [Kaiparowitsia implicata GSE-PSE-MK54-09C]|jgi:O-succinylbenzoic acid--CoA ligase|nr:AMP-binding protein [Kaiparowitsia implicata GSE-PSE-MK54-09C]